MLVNEVGTMSMKGESFFEGSSLSRELVAIVDAQWHSGICTTGNNRIDTPVVRGRDRIVKGIVS